MRTTAATVLFIVLLTSTAGAQSDRENALEAGAWALQFAVADNFRLSNFDGATIALKRHTADRTAWRVALSGSVRDDSFDLEQAESGVPAPDTRTGETEQSSWNFAIDLVRLRYAEAERTVHFFWGVGPTFGAGSSDRLSTNILEADDGSVRINRQDAEGTTWNVGGVALAGVEWFVTKDLSLHADYRVEGVYSSDDDEVVSTVSETGGPERVQRRTDDSTGWRLGGSAVRFGLSAYF